MIPRALRPIAHAALALALGASLGCSSGSTPRQSAHADHEGSEPHGHGHEHGHEHEHEHAATGGLAAEGDEAAALFTCPMGCLDGRSYPQAGRCPACGMALVPVESVVEPGTPEDHDHAAHGHAGADHMTHMNEVREWLRTELGASYDAPVAAQTAAQLEAGKRTYQATCAACHGSSGKGDGPASAALPTPPADFTDAAHSRFYSDMGRLHVIRKGIPQTLMVGWSASLSEAEILAVHGYVRSLRADDAGAPQAHPHGGAGHDHAGHQH